MLLGEPLEWSRILYRQGGRGDGKKRLSAEQVPGWASTDPIRGLTVLPLAPNWCQGCICRSPRRRRAEEHIVHLIHRFSNSSRQF